MSFLLSEIEYCNIVGSKSLFWNSVCTPTGNTLDQLTCNKSMVELIWNCLQVEIFILELTLRQCKHQQIPILNFHSSSYCLIVTSWTRIWSAFAFATNAGEQIPSHYQCVWSGIKISIKTKEAQEYFLAQIWQALHKSMLSSGNDVDKDEDENINVNNNKRSR